MDTHPMSVASFAANPDEVADWFQAQERRVDKRAIAKPDSAALPKHRSGERFIRGPIPLAWFKSAASCGDRAEAVAVLLWYAAGFQRRNPVKLSPAILRELKVHPKTARRVLGRMAERGLVRNEFRRGRSPMVTIVSPETADIDE